MVRWMVTILLRLAPDLDADPLHGYGDIQEAGMSTAIIEESMTAEIQEKAKLLFRCLRRLTTNLHNCCKGIVHDDHQESNGDGDGDGDKKIVGIEARDLHKIKVIPFHILYFIFTFVSFHFRYLRRVALQQVLIFKGPSVHIAILILLKT